MSSSSTKQYIFILGRERELCYQELISVLSSFCFKYDIHSLTDFIVLINFIEIDLEHPLDIQPIAMRLGGTIKVYEVAGVSYDAKPKRAILDSIVERSSSDRTIDFAISSYTSLIKRDELNKIGFSIKKELRAQSAPIATRFLALKEEAIASLAVLAGNKIPLKGYEFGIFQYEGKTIVGFLVFLSDPNFWSLIDFGKPAGDKYSGMLPPKLARIMINLALGSAEKEKDQPVDGSKINGRTLVIDPFCGSGNVLLQAILLGLDVIASDVSERAVNASRKNAEWLCEMPRIECRKEQWSLFQADAISEKLLEDLKLQINSYSNIAIVAEPYLGRPKKLKASYKDIDEYDEVKELYLAFLRNIAKLFHQSATNQTIGGHSKSKPVFSLVFPLVEMVGGDRFSLFALSVDEIEKIGYTIIRKPLIYGRDYQIVKREIVLLTLNS